MFFLYLAEVALLSGSCVAHLYVRSLLNSLSSHDWIREVEIWM